MADIVAKCIGGKIEKPWMVCGRMVCTATNPGMPNWSGHSRGRKIHLAKDETKTICNMLIDEYIPDSNKNWTMVHNGKCKNCFK